MLSYLATRSSSSSFSQFEDDNNLLWNVVHIAAKNRGRLRNDRNIKNALVDLLLASGSDEKQPSIKLSQEICSTTISGQQEVQSLLLRGERESAVSSAITDRNYALALVIASMCDRTTYQIAVNRFADECLQKGSPLHTAALLFSNNVDISDEDADFLKRGEQSSFWCREEYGNLEETWKKQLASIMSNQTVGWERIVLTLGDRLLQLGRIHAAHVCYLVSFTSFGTPLSNSQHQHASAMNTTARLMLLGVDNNSCRLHAHLMTPESIGAFYCTEAFEWARRRGNCKTHIPILQPYKLRYAELLADFGWEESAREYLLSIRSCIGGSNSFLPGHSTNTVSGNFSMAMLHDKAFIELLMMLEDRLCISSGAERAPWENYKKDNDSFKKGGVVVKAMGSIAKTVLGKKPPKVPKTETVCVSPSRHGNGAESKEKNTEIDSSLSPQQQRSAESQKKPREDTAANLSATFSQVSSATSCDPPLLSNPFSNNQVGGGNKNTKHLLPQPSKEESKEKDTESIPQTPIAPKVDEKKKKAPSSEPLRSTGWLSKLLGRGEDKEKATVADVGEEMQAYYDKKLKRWIFPGDDPAEVAKPLGPPPILPKKTSEAPATPASDDLAGASNDPIAALMAPPSSRSRIPSSFKKKGPPIATPMPAAGGFTATDPFLASMGRASSMNKQKIPDSPMANKQQNITIATFQPNLASSAPSSSDTTGGKKN